MPRVLCTAFRGDGSENGAWAFVCNGVHCPTSSTHRHLYMSASASLKPGNAFLTATRNMLFDCGGITPAAKVLVVREAPGLGYYADDLAPALQDACRSLGLHADLTTAPFEPEAVELPPRLVREMASYDMTVFLARIGDQVRFIALPEGARAIVSYALSIEAMCSSFGTTPYEYFVELKDLLEAAMADANIHITCPHGTSITGLADAGPQAGGEVSIRRFPLLVPRPVLAARFSGKASLCGFLVGTGNSYYDHYGIQFEQSLKAHFENGEMSHFEGHAADVARANQHYDRISRHFGVERNYVHSWHAGIHPACTYEGKAADNFEAWSGSAFGNPRLLHFHTCGKQPPGEISWNIVDPTIAANGVVLWENGRLRPDNLPEGQALLKRSPDLAQLFAAPGQAIGV